MNIVNLIRKTVRGAAFDDNVDGIGQPHSVRKQMPIRSPVLVYLLACMAIAVGGSIARADWRQFRFDPAHHGVNPNETILSPANVANLTVKWRTDIGGGCFASADVVNGRLYTADTGSANGKLHAVDAVTGQELWTFPSDALPGDFAFASPAVMNGVVFYGVNRFDPVLFAVDATTGQEIWRHIGPLAQIVSSPTVATGRVYVAFTDGTIQALNATNGQVIWSHNHPAGAYSSPAVADGRLYIAIHNQGLLALDANSGSQLWLAPMPGPQWSSPAVENGKVFVGSRDDHKLYAFDAVTGSTRWTATTSDWIQTSPAVNNGVVYIANNSGNVYAYNAETGGLIWQSAVSPGFAIGSSPTVANGVVYVASALDASARHFDGKLYAVNAANGQVLFSSVVSQGQGEARWVQASPTVDNGIVYLPNYGDGTVAAFCLPISGPITLSARGKKVQGINTSRLTWSGATSNNIDVNRDGVVIATTPNDGSYDDSTGTTGQARFTYKVCEAGTQTCSNEVTVRFRR
ncbi:MAG TPA: PQQ-binding-like beta-propeller repeat protein [Candidatus Udaeobacter sp.]|nr:PQQ-binding-like beta-propeller repeat protein [Candidatus Udaeobacter sp.]